MNVLVNIAHETENKPADIYEWEYKLLETWTWINDKIESTNTFYVPKFGEIQEKLVEENKEAVKEVEKLAWTSFVT